MTWLRTILTSLLLLDLATAQVRTPAFEVTSVKRASANGYIPPVVTPQRFHIVATLRDAIEWAFEVHAYQVSGGRAWTNREYYEIEGTSNAPASTPEMRRMLQSLLAERFKLAVHRESKDMAVYALVPGKGGLKLTRSSGACGSDGCINVGPGVLIARYATMKDTASTLSNLVDRPVMDRTGMEGHYDFRVSFDLSLIKPYADQPAARPDANRPSIFTAMEELGLKLDSARAPVELLLVDHADRPSAN